MIKSLWEVRGDLVAKITTTFLCQSKFQYTKSYCDSVRVPSKSRSCHDDNDSVYVANKRNHASNEEKRALHENNPFRPPPLPIPSHP